MVDAADLRVLFAGLLAAKTLLLAVLAAVAVQLRKRGRRTCDEIARLEALLSIRRAGFEVEPQDRAVVARSSRPPAARPSRSKPLRR
jgi:hypothetical protein